MPLLRKPGGGDTLCVNCRGDGHGDAQAARAQPEEQIPSGQGKGSGGMVQPVPPQRNGSSSGREGAEEVDEELLEAPPPLRSQLLPPGLDSEGARPAARQPTAAANGDSTSQRIADKMLEGWALLDESCPRQASQ